MSKFLKFTKIYKYAASFPQSYYTLLGKKYIENRLAIRLLKVWYIIVLKG